MIPAFKHNSQKQGVNDEFYTPVGAITPIISFLPKDLTYWEPCSFESDNIIKALPNLSWVKQEEDSQAIVPIGEDFLTTEKECDVILTNPPFSLKNKFLMRALQLDKPFMFLLPEKTLGSVQRFNLFKEHGISIIMLCGRNNFMTEKQSPWFDTHWFCHNWPTIDNNTIQYGIY